MFQILGSATGTFCLITYRPSRLAGEAYNAVGVHISTRQRSKTTLRCDQDCAIPSQSCRRGAYGSRCHRSDASRTADGELFRTGLAGVHSGRSDHAPCPSRSQVRRCEVAQRQTFRFHGAGGPLVAHNMGEFYRAVQGVPLTSLRHHMTAGDFSRSVEGVIGDQSLAQGLRKLERWIVAGATPIAPRYKRISKTIISSSSKMSKYALSGRLRHGFEVTAPVPEMLWAPDRWVCRRHE